MAKKVRTVKFEGVEIGVVSKQTMAAITSARAELAQRRNAAAQDINAAHPSKKTRGPRGRPKGSPALESEAEGS